MTPQIHFTIYDAKNWSWDDLPKLRKEMNDLFRKVKEASGYTWDNRHFFIDGIFGQPVMTISFYDDAVYCWLPSGTSVLPKARTYMELTMIHQMAENGLLYCEECGTWKVSIDFKSYSFAGVVCNKCYDPKRHLPPDTSGS